MARTTVAQIITIHRGDHHVGELQRCNRAGKVDRLVHIQRVGAAMAHIAKRAATCALITHDHEGSRAFTETFADIWARGLFADCV